MKSESLRISGSHRHRERLYDGGGGCWYRRGGDIGAPAPCETASERLRAVPRILPQGSHPSPPPILQPFAGRAPAGSVHKALFRPQPFPPRRASLIRRENSCGGRDTYLFPFSIPFPWRAGGLGWSPVPQITGHRRTEASPGRRDAGRGAVPAAPARDNTARFQDLLPLSPVYCQPECFDYLSSFFFFFPLFWHFPKSSVILLLLFERGTDRALFSKHGTHALESKWTMAEHIWSALAICKVIIRPPSHHLSPINLAKGPFVALRKCVPPPWTHGFIADLTN